MPALKNPRWERFCQIIVFGDISSQKHAYLEAGYKKANGASAEQSASRLSRSVKAVADRIRELQAEQKAKFEFKDRFTRNTLANRMALASKIAEEDRNPSAIAANELGIAKLFGLLNDTQQHSQTDLTQCRSMAEIGTKLLQSVGLPEPDDASVQLAIKANDTFIRTLEQIAAQAQGLTVDQADS